MNQKKFIKIIFGAAPVAIAVVLFSGLVHGIFKGLETVLMQHFFDDVTGWGTGTGRQQEILVSLAGLAAVMILGYIFNGVHNALMESTSFKIMGAMSEKFHKKTAELDAEFYEDSANLDCLEKAGNGIEQGTFFMNVCFSIVTYYIPYFIFMSIYLVLLKPVFVWAVVLVFVPVLLSQIYRNKMYHKCEDASAVYERKFQHYENCMKDRRYFKETRMLGAYHFFRDLYEDNIRKHNAVKWKTVKRTNLAELGAKAITLAGYMLIVVMFARAVLKGEISVGAFAALFVSVNTMFHTMEELVCGHIGRISENLICVQNYMHFLDMPVKDGHLNLDKGLSIEAIDLSYRYPGSDKMALDHLNIQIEAGETIAIVGENGAGKTTLMKLLSGQYAPTDGKLLIGGLDSRKIERKSLSENMSAVFQNYQKYAMTLGENVCISNTQNKELSKDADEKAVELLNQTGLDQTKMQNGPDTMLSREFGGTDLSGGEWQKVAIARGAYKDCSFMILDEPTAAIDPLEENRLYQLFRQMSREKRR